MSGIWFRNLPLMQRYNRPGMIRAPTCSRRCWCFIHLTRFALGISKPWEQIPNLNHQNSILFPIILHSPTTYGNMVWTSFVILNLLPFRNLPLTCPSKALQYQRVTLDVLPVDISNKVSNLHKVKMVWSRSCGWNPKTFVRRWGLSPSPFVTFECQVVWTKMHPVCVEELVFVGVLIKWENDEFCWKGYFVSGNRHYKWVECSCSRMLMDILIKT